MDIVETPYFSYFKRKFLKKIFRGYLNETISLEKFPSEELTITFLRSSDPKVFCKKSIFKKFSGKYFSRSLFLTKRDSELWRDTQKETLNLVFSNEFRVKICRTAFLQNTSGRVILFSALKALRI